MKISIKNAAENSFQGIKAMIEFLDDEGSNYENVGDFIDDLNEIIVKYQPQLAAYCVFEYIKDQQIDEDPTDI